MQPIARSAVLDVRSVVERCALVADPSLVTLQGAFAAVPDPLRYDLPFLLPVKGKPPTLYADIVLAFAAIASVLPT